MVRPPHGGGNKYNKWTPEEDHILVSYVQENSPVNWASVPDNTGLKRRGTSCRFRWINYLRPGIRRGNFTDEEDRKIIYLQSYLGNRWSSIAAFFPDRTHNDIKNYWNAYLKKKVGSAPGVNSAPPNTCRVLASYSVMTYRFSSFTYNVNWNRISAPGVAGPAPVSAIAVPVRPSAVALPYAAAPTPAFAVPVRPYAVAPPYAAPPTPAFAVPVRPSAFATPYAAAPTPAFAVPVRPSAVAPPCAAASTPAFAVLVRPSAVAPPYAAAPISAFAVPVCPSAAVPPYAAAPTPAFAVQGPVHPAFSAPTSVNTVPVHPSAAAPSAPSAAAPPHLV